MKIIFVSNFMNHHQKPWCDAMIKKNIDFNFISYSDVPEEQLNLGYSRHELPYIIHRNDSNDAEINEIIMNADVVIFGEKPEAVYKPRCNTGKLTFIFTERLFKMGRWRRFIPTILLKLHKKFSGVKDKQYLLCASAYAARDYQLIGFPKSNAFKWGYFPEVGNCDIDCLLAKKAKPATILWVGRLIDWKHPEYAVMVADYLVEHNADFTMKIIGTGDLSGSLEKLIEKKNLNNHVKLVGSLPSETVREEMEAASIAIATSDYREGWGAVINEEMSSACAVVACSDMGSVPYLIEDGVNGYIYSHSDVTTLCEKVLTLVNDTGKCKLMGKNAYETMCDLWNSDVAVDRLLTVIDSLENNISPDNFTYGPMSRA